MLFGFYGPAPHARVLIGDFSKTINLCFFFCGLEAEGEYTVDLHMNGPSGQPIDLKMPSAKGAFKAGIPTTFVILQFSGILPGPGPYTVSLTANGERQPFTTTFELVSSTDENIKSLR